MKALSLHQPWASMVAAGIKTIETRTRPTSHRGELLICATKRPRTGAPPHFLPDGSPCPHGVALAVVRVVDCRPMTSADEVAAGCKIYPRAQAWVLELVRRVEPFPVTGRQGFFEVELAKR